MPTRVFQNPQNRPPGPRPPPVSKEYVLPLASELTARRIAVAIAEELLAVKIEPAEGQSIAARVSDACDVVPDMGDDQIERNVLLRVRVDVGDDAAIRVT